MRSWKKATTGLLFLAASSVYAGRATGGAAAGGANQADLTIPAPNSAADTLALAPEAPTTLPVVENGGSTSAKVTSSLAGFDIDVTDADVVQVIRMLSIESKRNIVASKDVRGKVTASLHNVTVKEALDAVLKAYGYAYREKGNFIYVYTQKEYAEIEKAERQMTTEVFHVYYTPAANAVTMIKPILSADAQVSFSTASKTGIASDAKDAGGNDHAANDLIVVRDYQENIDRVRKLMKEVDQRPQQILIEAVILRASLSDDNALGIDFTVFGGVDFNSINGTGSTPADALSGAILTNSKAGNVTDSGYGGSSTDFTKNVRGGGLKVGLVKNNVALFLAALEEATYTTVLANPKVLTLNKQRGEVIVGKKTGYLTTTLTDTTAVQSVEFLETGTRLVFRPYIGDDGYVRLEVHPEDSDGGLVNNLPVKTTTEVTSNVMVKDGHTIVIGGLFRESSDISRGQVPGLGNLPVAGPLFRSQADKTTREEIIILLTPHIVKSDSAYARASEEAEQQGEKLRMGVRSGMMCFSRERLADASYEKAVAEMGKGAAADREKAIWYLDCATNLRPTFLEAIDMKSKLTGTSVTLADNSTIRGFLKRQILAERAIQPAGDAPAPTTAPAPAGPRTEVPATGPATKPALAADAPTTAPATQPVADATADDSATDESCECEENQAAVESDPALWTKNVMADEKKAEPTTAPATQPTVEDENAKGATVTELPADEAGAVKAGAGD